MAQFIGKILITAFGLWIADLVLAGVQVDSITTLWLSALVLGVVNALVRPLVVLLTLPITFLTFGLFLLIVNGAMFLLVARLVPSFHVTSLGAAIAAWLIVTLVNWVIPVPGQGQKAVHPRRGGD